MCSTSVGATRAVEGDADCVEADLGVAGELAAFAHPGGRQAPHLQLLAPVDAEDGALGAEGRAGAAGLDLDEDERAAVEGDDVELAEAGASVALDDLPARGGEAGGDEILGGAADSLSLRGHRDRP